MTFENDKVIAEIGALLMVISPIASTYGSLLILVGFVLLIVALNGLADHYKDRSIFRNVVYGGVAFFVGVVIAVVILVVAAVGALSVLGIPTSGWSDPAVWRGIDWRSITNWSALAPYIGVAIVGLVVLFAFSILAAIRIRRSLKTLAERSGITMFATSGTVLFIGAVLTIIVIGLILLWIALILLAIAFFRLRSEPTPLADATPSTFCTNCGAKLEAGWTHCPKCGKGLGPNP